MTLYRLGVVPYVNALPLWVPLEKHLVSTQHSFTFEKSVPDRLARDLASTQVDCALLSIVEAMKNQRLRVVDGVCIASKGAVETVQLFHQKPLASCRKILLDGESRTSSFVAKLLLDAIFPLSDREFSTGLVDPSLLGVLRVKTNGTEDVKLTPLEHGEAVDRGMLPPGPLEGAPGGPQIAAVVASRHPTRRGIATHTPLSEYDAFLSIGDKTWTFLQSSWDRTDLGELWVNHTQLPMVWAAWTAGESLNLRELAPILVRSREVGISILDDIIRRLSRSSAMDKQEIFRYLTEVMHYKMGADEKLAVTKMFEMGAAQGMLPPNPRVFYVS